MTFTNVELLRETDKAYLAWFGDYDWERWIPKTQLRAASGVEYHVGYKGNVVIADWLGKKFAEEFPKAEKPKQEVVAGDGISLVQANRVYRKLSVKYHPDHSDSSTEVMRDVNELWDAIKAEVKRINNPTNSGAK